MELRNPPSLAIVVPCFNEEEVFFKTLKELETVVHNLKEKLKVTNSSKIYFIDDGSSDNTWQQIRQACASQSVIGVRLSKNKGHQNAVYAGLSATVEDVVVTIDADLQDDPINIEAMIDAYLAGNDVVYGVRSNRDSDSWFKRSTAQMYYKIMNAVGVDLIFNHADFRLMSRRVVNALHEYPEVNMFLRGIVRKIGFSSTIVEYERKVREHGESKYPLRKMLSFAWEGISSFSTAPLRAITVLGLASSFASLLVIAWVFIIWVSGVETVPGWASILVPLLFIGSVQLLSLGVLGEYVAKIFQEVKNRPRFHVDERIDTYDSEKKEK
ncbi:MAG: glycosyltransferase involved in cell wall biosynthesis [Bermanella sp.]|jgi:glycosyltransferase involved in cell wall biosynthesis